MWVSAQMGHKDWGFTARTYAKFIDSDQASAGSKLEALQRDQTINLGGQWLQLVTERATYSDWHR